MAITGAAWLDLDQLPAPTDVLAAGVRLTLSGELLRHMGVSAWRAILGFFVGAGVGFVFGVLTGTFRIGEKLLDTLIQLIFA